MAFRGPVELESTLNARLYHVTNNTVTGARAKERLQSILEVSIKSQLLELAGNNMIPNSLIKEDIDRWAQRMCEIGVFSSSIEVSRTPQVILNLRNMTEAIFRDYTPPRVPISPFVRPGVGFQGVRATKTIQDEHLALDLEERGLKDILLPKEGSIKTEGRRRIGAALQQTLAGMEAHRTKQMEEQRKKDQEEKEIEETGFGRKVDLD